MAKDFTPSFTKVYVERTPRVKETEIIHLFTVNDKSPKIVSLVKENFRLLKEKKFVVINEKHIRQEFLKFAKLKKINLKSNYNFSKLKAEIISQAFNSKRSILFVYPFKELEARSPFFTKETGYKQAIIINVDPVNQLSKYKKARSKKPVALVNKKTYVASVRNLLKIVSSLGIRVEKIKNISLRSIGNNKVIISSKFLVNEKTEINVQFPLPSLLAGTSQEIIKMLKKHKLLKSKVVSDTIPNSQHYFYKDIFELRNKNGISLNYLLVGNRKLTEVVPFFKGRKNSKPLNRKLAIIIFANKIDNSNIALIQKLNKSLYKGKTDLLLYVNQRISKRYSNKFGKVKLVVQNAKKIDKRYYELIADLRGKYKYKPIVLALTNSNFFENSIDTNDLEGLFINTKRNSGSNVLLAINNKYPHIFKSKFRNSLYKKERKVASLNVRAVDIPMFSMSQIRRVLKHRKGVFLKLDQKVKLTKGDNFAKFIYSLVKEFGDHTVYLVPMSSESLIRSVKTLRAAAKDLGHRDNMIIGILDEQLGEVSTLLKNTLDHIAYSKGKKQKRLLASLEKKGVIQTVDFDKILFPQRFLPQDPEQIGSGVNISIINNIINSPSLLPTLTSSVDNHITAFPENILPQLDASGNFSLVATPPQVSSSFVNRNSIDFSDNTKVITTELLPSFRNAPGNWGSSSLVNSSRKKSLLSLDEVKEAIKRISLSPAKSRRFGDRIRKSLRSQASSIGRGESETTISTPFGAVRVSPSVNEPFFGNSSRSNNNFSSSRFDRDMANIETTDNELATSANAQLKSDGSLRLKTFEEDSTVGSGGWNMHPTDINICNHCYHEPDITTNGAPQNTYGSSSEKGNQ